MSLESAVSNTISGLQNFETKQKIAYQLAAKSLDITQQKADAVLELIEAAAPIGKTPGAGRHFDARA